MRRVAPLGQMKVRKIESDNNGHGGQVDTKVMEKNRRSMGEAPKGKRGKVAIKYRECRRNYAASIGRIANDGCREFMPGGTEGTREAVWCGACGCHQNFHRKEQSGGGAAAYGHPPPPPPTYLYNAVGSIPSSSARREKNPVGGGFPPPLPPSSLPQQPLPPLPAPTAAPAPAPAPAFCCQQEQSDKHKYERRSKKMEVEAGKRKNKRVRTNP